MFKSRERAEDIKGAMSSMSTTEEEGTFSLRTRWRLFEELNNIIPLDDDSVEIDGHVFLVNEMDSSVLMFRERVLAPIRESSEHVLNAGKLRRFS